MKSNNQLAILAALAGNSISGFNFIFIKTALHIVEPFTMLAVRFSVALLVMSVIALTGLTRIRFKGKKLGGLLCLGMIPVVYSFFESYGLKYVATSVAGVLFALIPVVVTVLGVLFLKEKPALVQIISILVSVSGVAVISILGQSAGQTSVLGMILIFGGVMCASAYTLLSRKLASVFTPFERTYVTGGLAAAVYTACAIISSGRDFFHQVAAAATNISFVFSILYLAVIFSVGATILTNYAIGKMSVSRSSSFTNLNTVVTVAVGVMILHEPFSWWQAAAALLVVSRCVRR